MYFPLGNIKPSSHCYCAFFSSLQWSSPFCGLLRFTFTFFWQSNVLYWVIYLHISCQWAPIFDKKTFWLTLCKYNIFMSDARFNSLFKHFTFQFTSRWRPSSMCVGCRAQTFSSSLFFYTDTWQLYCSLWELNTWFSVLKKKCHLSIVLFRITLLIKITLNSCLCFLWRKCILF